MLGPQVDLYDINDCLLLTGEMAEPKYFADAMWSRGEYAEAMKPQEPCAVGDVDDKYSYLYLVARRKAGLDYEPQGWEEVAWERGIYIECMILRKPTVELSIDDKDNWLPYHGKRPKEWFKPENSPFLNKLATTEADLAKAREVIAELIDKGQKAVSASYSIWWDQVPGYDVPEDENDRKSIDEWGETIQTAREFMAKAV